MFSYAKWPRGDIGGIAVSRANEDGDLGRLRVSRELRGGDLGGKAVSNEKLGGGWAAVSYENRSGDLMGVGSCSSTSSGGGEHRGGTK